jgi:hypothetical protein
LQQYRNILRCYCMSHATWFNKHSRTDFAAL